LEAVINVDWDERVADWHGIAESPAFQRLADVIVDVAAPVESDHAVDIGAGTGLLTFRLAPVVSRVVAVDGSAAMIARVRASARKRAVANVDTRVGDFRLLDLPDASFTLAVSNYAYHHVDHAGKVAALRELLRVMAPGGRVVISDMMFSVSVRPRDRRIIWDKVRLMSRQGLAGYARILRNAWRVAMHRWEYPERPSVWAKIMSDAGFVDVVVHELFNEGGMATGRRPPVGAEPADSSIRHDATGATARIG
jgi:ubiquinone/menaquinone biosynthesis C-methylase UbiE